MIRKALLVSITAAAWLATTDAAAAQKLEYDCDTAADHFSDLKLAQNAAARSVRATITARAFYKSKSYLSLANLKLAAPDNSWWVVIRIGGTAKAGTKAALAHLRFMRAGQIDEQLLGVVDASAPIAASLEIGADGKGTATIGGKSMRFEVPSGPVTAGVSCSTGEFLFSDLVIGD